MQIFDAIERDFAAALIALLNGLQRNMIPFPIPGDMLEFIPDDVTLSEKQLVKLEQIIEHNDAMCLNDKETKQLYCAYSKPQVQAVLYLDKMLKFRTDDRESFKTNEVLKRRHVNIKNVNENFNLRKDLLHNVDLALSPELKTLEPHRYKVTAIVGSSPEGERVSPAVGDQQGMKKKRGVVTQKTAAALYGVSEKTINNWVNGKQPPDRFPGLYDLAQVKAHAETYQGRRLISKKANAISRATTRDTQDETVGHFDQD